MFSLVLVYDFSRMVDLNVCVLNKVCFIKKKKLYSVEFVFSLMVIVYILFKIF